MITLRSSGQSWKSHITRNDSGETLIKFSEELALDKVLLPTISAELWGNGLACRAATISIASKKFLSSAKENESKIEFLLNGVITDQVQVVPVFTEPDQSKASGSIKIEAVRGKVRLIENEIFSLAKETLAFQKANKCFSCHTAFPMAMILNEADKNGYKVPQNEIELLGESIGAMQNLDGTFHFPNQPDYGTISPTLCAGAILSLLTRFDRRMLVNLDRILPLFSQWQDESGDLKSDFFFKPLFLGQTSTTLFETLIVSTQYYFEPSITGAPLNESLRQRLVFLNHRHKINPKSDPISNLLILVALPYVGQMSYEQKNDLIESLKTFISMEPEASRIDVAALTGLFLSKMRDKEGLKKLAELNFSPRTLSERIWQCLFKILLTQIK